MITYKEFFKERHIPNMENKTYSPTAEKAIGKKSEGSVLKSNVSPSVLMPAVIIAVAICIILILSSVLVIVSKANQPEAESNLESPDIPENQDKDNTSKANYPFKQSIENFYPDYAEDVITIDAESISSTNAALVDLSSNKIIASVKSGKGSIVYPASLTKVMTLIVVFENLKSNDALNEKLTLSEAVVNKMVEQDSSGYGFKAGEVLTVNELIHAVMLYSDGTACITLAEYISGSETKFVELMNAKAQEMGLQNTTFQNCTGLHHQYHYSTAQDLAAIMSYAMKNTFCANVITAKSFKFGSHFRPDGNGPYTMYNQFLIGSLKVDSASPVQPSACTILGGKTGLTDEAQYCLVTYAKTKDGKEYVLVTCNSESATLRNQDHIDIYNQYVK